MLNSAQRASLAASLAVYSPVTSRFKMSTLAKVCQRLCWSTTVYVHQGVGKDHSVCRFTKPPNSSSYKLKTLPGLCSDFEAITGFAIYIYSELIDFILQLFDLQ
ncbi:unnamed protein product [Heligmosomoides polygyrus]|uniref:Secreted protein n=1 Tax=Heligmosomoides polygyrus TaxID=6339 RepID=A0A183FNK7_HELPZ|nr:unnamed protein product [Heligmosomoides polygyrus]